MSKEEKQEEVKPAPTIDYTVVGEGKKKNKSSKKHIRVLVPNQKIITGFGLVILGVLMITALNFPINSFLSAREGATASVGFPFTFLIIQISSDAKFYIIGLIENLLIYSIVAYAINIFLNLVSNMKNFKTKETADVSPTVFKDQKITTTDKLAEKVSQ